MLEKTQVVILSETDDPPRECERCRTSLHFKQSVNSMFSMYECDYVMGEVHRVYAISEWLAVHVMNEMAAFIERGIVKGDESDASDRG